MLGWEVIPRIPLGDLSVSPHGVGIAVGYFIGATLMARRARRTGFDEDHAWNAAVVGILGAIIGARIAYVIGHQDRFSEPIEYLQIYKGGISLMGGLIGGFTAAWLYCRAKKLDFLRLADLGAAGLAIGTAVGRIGDLVIGDHLGRTTDGFWAWEYQGGELISSPPCDPAVYPSPTGCIEPGMVVHQTALYDSIWALVIFFILLRLERKPRPKGFLVFTWAAMYSAGRILTDLTRVDKTWFGTGFTGSQLTAIIVLALSLFFLVRLRKAPRMPALTPGDKAGVVASPSQSAEAEAEEPDALTHPVPAGDEPDPADEPAEVGTAESVEPVETGAPEDDAASGPLEDEPVVPVAPVDAGAPEAASPARPVEPDSPEAVPAATEQAEVTPEAVAAVDSAEAVVSEAAVPARPADTVEEKPEPAAQEPSEPETMQPEAEAPEERQEP
ncbi:hypothetical protein BH23ACT12_BH23ACT12_21750 [soil metagenome]